MQEIVMKSEYGNQIVPFVFTKASTRTCGIISYHHHSQVYLLQLAEYDWQCSRFILPNIHPNPNPNPTSNYYLKVSNMITMSESQEAKGISYHYNV